MLRFILIVLFVVIQSVASGSVEEFNNKIDTLSKYIQDGNFSASKELMVDMISEAKTCDFGIYETRKEDPSYISGYIKKLPNSLDIDTYFKIEKDIREGYHNTLQAIEDANNKIAVKKYFLALKIILTGFDVFKSTIDLIKTDYGLSELVKLPKDLSDLIEKYKQDAENIKNKFESIKLEKEKKRILEKYKRYLVELTYKIRGIKSFLYDYKLTISDLYGSVKYCNKKIALLNALTFPPQNIQNIVDNCSGEDNSCQNSGTTTYTLNDFDKEIVELKSKFSGREIGLFDYSSRIEGIKARIDSICSNGYIECKKTQNLADLYQPCYSIEGGEIVCSQPDANLSYQRYYLKVRDGEIVKEITPSRFDYEVLSNYVTKYNEFLKKRDLFMDTFYTLENNITYSSFMLEDENYTKRPIELQPVDILNEINALRSDSSECGEYESNLSVSFVEGGSISFYDKTPAYGPQVFSDDDSKIWYERINYADNVLNLSKKLYRTALLAYASTPRCAYESSNCSFATALFSPEKIRDIAYNITLLKSDLDSYVSDMRKVDEYVENISTTVKNLSDQFDILRSYRQYLNTKDMDFSVTLFDDIKRYTNTKLYSINFLQMYQFFDLLDSIGDSFKSKLYETEYKEESAKEYITREYIDDIDDNFDFNRKLKEFYNSFSLNEDNSTSFVSNLTSIKNSLTNLLYDIKEDKRDFIYSDASKLKGAYNAFKSSDYRNIIASISEIGDYFTQIKDASFRYYKIFTGEKVVFGENKDAVEQMLRYYWPSCESGLGQDSPEFLEYLNYSQIDLGLPKIKSLTELYTGSEYKPVDPNEIPTKYILDSYDFHPSTLNGPGTVYVHAKFKKVKGIGWNRVYIAVRTDLDSDMYRIESVDGYNQVYDGYENYFHDHFYIYPNSNGEIAFKFVLLKDHKDEPYVIPYSEIPLGVYMTSSEIYYPNYSGEFINAAAINIENLKYLENYDKNGNEVADEWENKYSITDLDADDDGDGLDNRQEYLLGSDPTLKDSDGDGLNDLIESENSLDPQNPDDADADFDGDGVSNRVEIINGFDMFDKNSPKNLIYAKVYNLRGDLFDVNISAKVEQGINDINLTIAFPNDFKVVDGVNNMGILKDNNKTIEIDKLKNGDIVKFTFKNIGLSDKFTLELNSSKIFANDLTYKIPLKSFYYSLKKGWNFISNAFDGNLTLKSFDKCDVVWGYENGWFAYSIKYSSELNSIGILQQDFLEPDRGAWVYCDKNMTAEAKGLSIKESIFKKLDSKWNLVGLNDNLPVDVLYVLYPEAKIVWTWRDGKWFYALNRSRISGTLPEKDTLEILPKNSAAWIYYDK